MDGCLEYPSGKVEEASASASLKGRMTETELHFKNGLDKLSGSRKQEEKTLDKDDDE